MPRTPSGGKGKTDGRITPHMHGAKRVTKKAHVDLAPHVPKDTIVRVESVEDDGSAIISYEQEEAGQTLIRTMRLTPAKYKGLGNTQKKLKSDEGDDADN